MSVNFMYALDEHLFKEYHPALCALLSNLDVDIWVTVLDRREIWINSARLPDLEKIKSLLILLPNYSSIPIFPSETFYKMWVKHEQ